MKDVMAIIMAGGKGTRLWPLTKDRTKPAVPFGGIYRLIDIVLSNCINSEIYKIVILPQYKCQSLVDHLEAGWNIFSPVMGHYMKIVPPQQRTGEIWYLGTADAIRQNLYLIEREAPKDVLILSGDHVYKMNYGVFRKFHQEQNADITIGVIEVRKELATQYGVLEVDSNLSVIGFEEKPESPKTLPDNLELSLSSMGVYIFKTEVLMDILKHYEGNDFGQDIIPNIINSYKTIAYPYKRFNRIEDYEFYLDEDEQRIWRKVACTKDSSYWRDVGNLDEYWNANMDLTGIDPYFNLYGRNWPIITHQRQYPPAKTVFSSERGNHPRVGKALDSLISHGCIISGAVVRNSVLSPGVIIHSWAQVEESVIMEGVEIGRGAKIKKAIIDKDNFIPEGEEIGLNPKKDRERFTVTSRGIVVVEKMYFQ